MFTKILRTPRLDPGTLEVDTYGYDQSFHKAVLPVLDYLYNDYFTANAWGMDKIPTDKPAILVSNHAGFLPLDALMLQHAIFVSRKTLVRPLLEDVVMTMPFAAGYLPKLGFARASRVNAIHMLNDGLHILTFPEGVKGLEKTRNERCKVKRFGRGGVIKLALMTGAPIIPVAIAGPGAAYPMLFRIRSAGRLLGLPFLPITPIFPLLGPLGLVPLKVPLRIRVGDPMDIRLKKGQAEEPFILKMNERVRSAVKELVQGLVAEKKGDF